MRRRVVAPAALNTAQNQASATEYFEREGKSWIPVVGEYHFSRDRPERWQRELHKIAAGGVDVVSTFLLWNRHEEVRGKVRWNDHLDLRRWVQAAQTAGLKVVIRIGGIPGWLEGRRPGDPAYLGPLRGWFTAIEEQVRGLDDSIIGMVIESELYDQPEHLQPLRQMAESVGLRAGLWTSVGWEGAQLSAGSLLPFSPTDASGGGMQVSYHRRPLVDPDDVRLHKLRRQNLFLQTYGTELARHPMVLSEPADDVRWALRAHAERGYLFVSSDLADVQFEVQFADRSIVLPPVNLYPGASFAWPLRQRFNDIPALTVTAQPITELEVGDETYVLFAATPGIDVELFVEGVDADWVLHADVEPAEGGLIVRPEREPGRNCEIWIGMTTLVFLDEVTADTVWKGEVAGRERLLIWPGNGWFDGGFHAVVGERDRPLDAFPALAQGVTHVGQGSVFTRYLVPGSDVTHPLTIPAFPKAVPAPVRRGGGPVDEDFEHLEAVEVQIPPGLLEGAGPLVLRLNWTGDVLRLWAGREMIVEQVWSGRELEVDLTPFQERISAEGLWLKAFAWAPDSEVFVDPRVRPQTETPLLMVHEASLMEIRTREMR